MASTAFTSEERISELSAINADVAEMLKQAGQAVNVLTNRPLAQDEDGDQDMGNGQQQQQPASSGARRDAFKKHTTAFYTGVQSVTARLRRNAYGLEEAGIISADTPAEQAPRPAAAPQPGRPARDEASRITNGGMGNLDVGWLNSRGNKVGAEKENELMREAKELLQAELAKKKDDGGPT